MEIASKLRISEKIGFGFGIVGLLFVGVIWQYHNTLQRSLAGFHDLQQIYGTKKDHALAIERSMLDARRAEKDFLISRDETHVQEVSNHLENILQSTAKLGTLDKAARQASARISDHTRTYHQRFDAIVEA